jgi:hypothetical protein
LCAAFARGGFECANAARRGGFLNEVSSAKARSIFARSARLVNAAQFA